MSAAERAHLSLATEQRLDKWLWHARFARTRSAAARLVEEGHVRINGKRETTCAKRIRGGDILTIALGHGIRVVRLRAIAVRRGSASEAATLYEAMDETLDAGAT